MENVFKLKKADKSVLKQPIPSFVERNWREIKGLQRQFIEEMLRADQSALKKAGFSKKDSKLLRNINGDLEKGTPKGFFAKPKIDKEKFKREKRKNSNHESYMTPSKKRLAFNPLDCSKERKRNPDQQIGSPAFVNFWSKNWKEVALCSPSVALMRTKLITMWHEMSDNQRRSFSTQSSSNKQHCVCKKTYSQDNSFMVACHSCNRWYHTKCINFSDAISVTAGYYLCNRCFVEKICPLAHLVNHSLAAGELRENSSFTSTIH